MSKNNTSSHIDISTQNTNRPTYDTKVLETRRNMLQDARNYQTDLNRHYIYKQFEDLTKRRKEIPFLPYKKLDLDRSRELNEEMHELTQQTMRAREGYNYYSDQIRELNTKIDAINREKQLLTNLGLYSPNSPFRS